MWIHAFLVRAQTLLYAPSCAACDASTAADEALCSECMISSERLLVTCPTCALPLAGPLPIRCARCVKRPLGVDSCTAVFEYGGQLRVALMRLKFAGRSDIARTLVPLLLPSFASVAARTDLALAMPLHKARLARRGFNQCQRLLTHLAPSERLPLSYDGLRRIRATTPQARLDARARAANLRSAFLASSEVEGRRILLLDDVLTTGETVRAAARALRRAGAREIHAFVVARAEWHSS